MKTSEQKAKLSLLFRTLVLTPLRTLSLVRKKRLCIEGWHEMLGLAFSQLVILQKAKPTGNLLLKSLNMVLKEMMEMMERPPVL